MTKVLPIIQPKSQLEKEFILQVSSLTESSEGHSPCPRQLSFRYLQSCTSTWVKQTRHEKKLSSKRGHCSWNFPPNTKCYDEFSGILMVASVVDSEGFFSQLDPNFLLISVPDPYSNPTLDPDPVSNPTLIWFFYYSWHKFYLCISILVSVVGSANYERYKLFRGIIFRRKFADIFAAQGAPPMSLTPVENEKNLQSEKF
jgi:hypothetical protein